MNRKRSYNDLEARCRLHLLLLRNVPCLERHDR
jgi:hypothetical protein